jgi:hypothetical protein
MFTSNRAREKVLPLFWLVREHFQSKWNFRCHFRGGTWLRRDRWEIRGESSKGCYSAIR